MVSEMMVVTASNLLPTVVVQVILFGAKVHASMTTSKAARNGDSCGIQNADQVFTLLDAVFAVQIAHLTCRILVSPAENNPMVEELENPLSALLTWSKMVLFATLNATMDSMV